MKTSENIEEIIIEGNIQIEPSQSESEPVRKKEVLQRILKSAAPFAFNRFIGIGAENINRFMLGQLGPEYLAAAGLYASTSALVVTTSAASLYATASIMGKEIREGSTPNVGKVLNASLIYASVLGATISILLSFSSQPLQLLGQNENIADITQEIFRADAIALGIIGNLVSVSCQQTCYTLEHIKAPVFINLARRSLSVLLSYLLIYGKLGLPEMKESGLGLAEAISTDIDVLLFFLFFIFSQKGKEFELLRSNLIQSIKFLKPLLYEGPIFGLQNLTIFLVNFINTIFAGIMGEDSLAAWEINSQYYLLLMIPITAASQAIFTLLKKTSTRAQELVKKIELLGYGSVSIISLVGSPVIFLLSPKLGYFFVRNYTAEESNQIMSFSKVLLRTTSLTLPFTTATASLGSVMRAKNYMKTPLLTNVFSLALVGLPLGYLLGFVFDLNVAGLALGLLVGLAVASLLLISARLVISCRPKEEPVLDNLPLLPNPATVKGSLFNCDRLALLPNMPILASITNVRTTSCSKLIQK